MSKPKAQPKPAPTIWNVCEHQRFGVYCNERFLDYTKQSLCIKHRNLVGHQHKTKTAEPAKTKEN
jgi:hypothetical protein